MSPAPLEPLKLNPEFVEVIRHAMVGVNKEGTGGAAFLNAAFGLCLGCEIYLRLPLQLRGRQAPPSAR